MDPLQALLTVKGIAPPVDHEQAAAVAELLSSMTSATVYPTSITAVDGAVLFMARRKLDKLLGIVGDQQTTVQADALDGERCEMEGSGSGLFALLCQPSHDNAKALRALLPFTAARVAGLNTSAGCGDRLGITTPGHIRALRGSGIVGVFAQQSIREMERTGRTPEQVMDDVTFGVFQEGYRAGFGSDADHLKTTEDIDACTAAGFTMFTADPGAHVDDEAEQDDTTVLDEKFENLPWSVLESTPSDCKRRYLRATFRLGEDLELTFTDNTLLRAAVKYGAAVAHAVRLYRHLAEKKGDQPFEFEVSVDETAAPTSPLEHFFVASELKRLGVKWVSLAPRFVGRFEKGVDYIGDLATFEAAFAKHAAIAREVGPYKISLHSGSDKFSVYPIAARHTRGLFHLKTAGTSYVEALRVVALCNPKLFREILAFAVVRYPEDRASYHVSAEADKVPDAAGLRDVQLAGVLDQFDAREALHVTYGSVLNATDDTGRPRFRDRLFQTLKEHEETYYTAIAKHIGKHIAPFIEPPKSESKPA